MTYKPNFNDTRVVNRIKKSINFVELYTNPKKVSSISSTQLYKYLGNTSKPLGKYLMDNLLVVVDRYYNAETHVCRKYRQNSNGVHLLKQAVGLESFIPELNDELNQQLDSGEIIYTEKSNRIYSPLQFIPKRIRGPLLDNKGYRYNYDIKAAAPTLLFQEAKKLNPDLNLSHLEHYINNRSQVRNQLAIECEITEDQVKFVINALLNGATISHWSQNKIFCELNCNHNSIIRLKNNITLIGISLDIKSMWKELKVKFPQRNVTDKRGITKSKRLTGRDKSSFYREIEEQVRDVIRRELKKQKIKHLWIHDGWCCDKVIDPVVIQSQVKRELNYSIELDWGIYEG